MEGPWSRAAPKSSIPAATSPATTLAARPSRGGPSVVVTFTGVGFAPGEDVAFQITASSDAVPADRSAAATYVQDLPTS
jgi:hypothetical protein